MVARLNKKCWWYTAVTVLCMWAGAGLGKSVSEEAIKATYILKLRPFVKINNAAHHPRTFCYYEKPGIPASESVGQIISKFVQDSPTSADVGLSVKWIKAIHNLSDAGCDIFYIPASEVNDIDNILTSLGASSTLTISGAERFILRGGMLGFTIDNESRVKMNANLENIKKRGIWIDSQILEIMQEVIGRN